MISEILKTRYKVGLFTSPYIEVFNERIQINGKNISSENLITYTNRVKTACESIPDFYPIEFEFITAMGFLFFAEQNCDVVVLETGLGGRLDSTNIVKTPLCTAICAIGLDHVAILGDTIQKIAAEKAGIIKQNVPVALFHDMEKTALGVIESVCQDKNAPVVSNVSDAPQNVSTHLGGCEFTYNGNSYKLSMTGAYQVQNALVAIDIANAVSDTLPLSQSDIRIGLEQAHWKCRFEVIDIGGDIVILDGAHNRHGVSAFLGEVSSLLAKCKKTFVFGMLNDKDFQDAISDICAVDADIIVTDVPSYRQSNSSEVFDCAKAIRPDAVYIKDCHEAIEFALSNNPQGGVVCVFGSLYLVGKVRSQVVDKM